MINGIRASDTIVNLSVLSGPDLNSMAIKQPPVHVGGNIRFVALGLSGGSGQRGNFNFHPPVLGAAGFVGVGSDGPGFTKALD